MTEQNSPPPLPAPIKFKRFEANKKGVFSVKRDRELLDIASTRAADWINSQSDLEIINIDTCCASILTTVTVWYR